MGLDGSTNDQATQITQHSALNSNFPVLLPADDSLFLPETEFQAFVRNTVTEARQQSLRPRNDGFTTSEKQNAATGKSGNELKRPASREGDDKRMPKSPFMEGLLKHEAHHMSPKDLAAENKTLTENADVTNISSKSALVDLFYDLGESTPGDKLKQLLESAWKEDALMTLKIIFNARSIHLGKSNKIAAYKAFGWLAEEHPLTFLTSLKWLVRPIIQKKVPKAEKGADQNGAKEKNIKDEEEDFDMIDASEAREPDCTDPAKLHDIRFGVSHGYWKDLLNLVALAANDELNFGSKPSSILSQKPDNTKTGKEAREWDVGKAKLLRRQKNEEHHRRVVQKLKNDAFYRALHLTVARLFAAQLAEDAVCLKSGKPSDLKKLSLAAKWAPSATEFHDKNTFIISSIAEILFPNTAEQFPDAGIDRELYLRHAREAYRKTIISPLRKALHVVERDIVANNFSNIQYERVPSLAMDRYTPLFVRKDYDHFEQYVKRVAAGSAKISGATLLPSTLVHKALSTLSSGSDLREAKTKAQIKAQAEGEITRQVMDGQWKSLVQRIRDSGSIESSIAVCDVSGSMRSPTFRDGTCPMHASIDLSLLLAEVTAPPFGGAFISFSEEPAVLHVGGASDGRSFPEMVEAIVRSTWGFSTNFVAVFESLILPMAVSNNIKPEDMVKQVIVFSDMQFNQAEDKAERWTSAFKRIKKKYEDAGYEMPRLIFWNLAASSTDKPTTMEDVNTALVSGYSQGMLKVFMDGGGFEAEAEIEEEAIDDEHGMTEIKVKQTTDPLSIVKKAVSHSAYSMLEIVD